MAEFTAVEYSGIALFADKIRQFDIMHNKQLRLNLDGENIYLPFNKPGGLR